DVEIATYRRLLEGEECSLGGRQRCHVWRSWWRLGEHLWTR
ncbi:KRT78 isoform 5, partial [Pongo abelii]